MKKSILALMFTALIGMIVAGGVRAAESGGTVTHIVFVWLKDPQNADAKGRLIAASKKLAMLPGVIFHRVGSAVPGKRQTPDDDFDIVVTVTLKNQESLEAYMAHPEHRSAVEDVMRPVVKKIRVYDFVSE